MAKLTVFAVRDRALDAFMRPFFMPTEGMAIRSFQDEVNRKDENNPLAQHPEDYDLYTLGTFDEDRGHFTQGEGEPHQIAIGNQMRIKS